MADWDGCLPVACFVYFVKVLSALLAEVLVGRALLGHDADAGAMLPDLADIALHKEARHILAHVESGEYYRVLCFLRLFRDVVEGRGPRVVIEATDAADGLVVFLYVITTVRHVCRLPP